MKRPCPTIVLYLLLVGGLVRAQESTGGSFENPIKLEPHRTENPADAPPECDPHLKQPRLAPGNRFTCRGIPFEVTFPKDYPFEQHWGNGWLSLQYSPTGRVILLSIRAAPWTLYPDRWKEVDDYLPRLFKSLKLITPEIGTPETVQVPGAEYAREVGFSAGESQTGTAGFCLSVIARGWVMHLLVSGKKGHPLRRGGEASEKILASVRVAPRRAPLLHRFRNGETIELPPDAWILMEKDRLGRDNPTYMTASDMTLFQIIEATSPKPCEQLRDQDWKNMVGDLTNQPGQTGKVNFGQSFYFELAGSRGFWASAETPAQFPQETGRRVDPAIATLICHQDMLFQMFSIATRSNRRKHRQTVERLLTSFRSQKD